MLEVLLIIAALAVVGVIAFGVQRCAVEVASLGLAGLSVNAQRWCGDVHQCGFDGLGPPGETRWTAAVAALARPAPRRG